MKKIVKLGFIFVALSALFTGCLSTDASPDDQAIERGISIWNNRDPEAAEAYWKEIADQNKQKQWIGYVSKYKNGVAALDSTDEIKETQEAKLLAAANKALDNFTALDERLELPADVCEKGANLSAGRVDKLLAAEKVSAARKMYNSAVKVYGSNDALADVGKEMDVVNVISDKQSALTAKLNKALALEDFDAKIVAVDGVIAGYKAAEVEINAAAEKNEVAKRPGVANNIRGFKKARQDVAVQREGLIREQAYMYKDAIGEEFARQPEGTGSGKNGEFTLEEILAHYKNVETNINTKYDELLAFSAKYPKDIGQDIIDDINAQKKDLQAKIQQINKEIAYKKEVESRGKTVLPLMIGLFNPAPGSTKESQKSRPAKFSSSKQKGEDYWWGMVSIKPGEMNDLVITLKDNRNVRVFNQNTHSGKDIEKKGLKDLVSKANKVGNSWPVLNAAKALGSDKYFFEIQKGKTDSYSGEVVVYSSFITRSR